MEDPSGHRRVGVDIGGTFTDLVVFDDATGSFAVGKTLTTPRDPSQAVETLVLEALEREGIAIGSVQQLIHGTTLVTNAIIERTGSHTALLATLGFRDSIEIGRENRYELYDLMLEMPQPLVPRYLRFGVPQRTLADGTTLQELDAAFVEQLTRELVANGIEAVAIAFLNSFANPSAEREARAIIQRVAPGMRVSISSEVVPEIREFERTSTTITNVYVQDRVREVPARVAGPPGSHWLHGQPLPDHFQWWDCHGRYGHALPGPPARIRPGRRGIGHGQLWCGMWVRRPALLRYGRNHRQILHHRPGSTADCP